MNYHSRLSSSVLMYDARYVILWGLYLYSSRPFTCVYCRPYAPLEVSAIVDGTRKLPAIVMRFVLLLSIAEGACGLKATPFVPKFFRYSACLGDTHYDCM